MGKFRDAWKKKREKEKKGGAVQSQFKISQKSVEDQAVLY